MKITELLIKQPVNHETDLLRDKVIGHIDKILGKESSKADRELLQKKLAADFLEISTALEQMSKSEITELFRPTGNWQWTEQGSYYAEAVFEIGGIPYIIRFAGESTDPWATWEVEFEVNTRQTQAVSIDKRHRVTGTGNSAEVFSTVTDIIRSFLRDYGNMVGALEFTANEPSRKKLYTAMVNRLLPNWHVSVMGTNFVVKKPELLNRKNISELFEPGRVWNWKKTDSTKARATFEVGGVNYIAEFNDASFEYDDGAWYVEFYVDTDKNTEIDSLEKYELTGTGNSVQVFSTMVSIIKAFLSYYHNVSLLVFEAHTASRRKLYYSIVKRILPNWEIYNNGYLFIVKKPDSSINESINRVPLSDKDFEDLGDIMSRSIPAAVASVYIQEIIDDDELTDNLNILAEQQPARDVRPIIADWFKRVMPDQLYRFIGSDKDKTNGTLSPLHGFNTGSHKGTNDPITGNAYGRT